MNFDPEPTAEYKQTVQSRPSRTAEYMALFRAIESSRPEGRRLFTDPFAADLLRGGLRIAALLARLPGGTTAISWFIDRSRPGPLPSAIVRTRVIDDAVEEGLGRGAAQMVILGAGFDSRGYRLPNIGAARVFELDHPATQAIKTQRLGKRLGRIPDRVSFVPIDLEREEPAARLERAGFRADTPSVFVWEGVTNYLTAAAVDQTIRSVARVAAPRSRLIFTYVHRGVLDGTADFGEADRWVQAVRAQGEPWTFGFDPEEVGSYLKVRGFTLLSDRSTLEASADLALEGARTVEGSALYHVAVAERR